jgi:hypothetical protein
VTSCLVERGRVEGKFSSICTGKHNEFKKVEVESSELTQEERTYSEQAPVS